MFVGAGVGDVAKTLIWSRFLLGTPEGEFWEPFTDYKRGKKFFWGYWQLWSGV